MSERRSSKKRNRTNFNQSLPCLLVVATAFVVEAGLSTAIADAQDLSTPIVCVDLVGSTITGSFQTGVGIPTLDGSQAIDSCTTADGQQGQPNCPDPTETDEYGNYVPWPGTCIVTQAVTVGKAIDFDNGTPVGGITKLTIWPDGSWDFNGWALDSGLTSYNVSTVGVVHLRSGQAFDVVVDGHLAGDLEPGSNRMDWEQSGTNPTIRDNWNDIDYVDVGYSVSLDATALVNETLTVVGTVTGIASL